MKKISFGSRETYRVSLVMRDSDGYLAKDTVLVFAHTGLEAKCLAIGEWMLDDYFGLGFWTVESVSVEKVYEEDEEFWKDLRARCGMMVGFAMKRGTFMKCYQDKEEMMMAKKNVVSEKMADIEYGKYVLANEIAGECMMKGDANGMAKWLKKAQEHLVKSAEYRVGGDE